MVQISLESEVNVYDFLIGNKIAYVKLTGRFKLLLLQQIIYKYGSLKNISKHIGIEYSSLKYHFSNGKHFRLETLLKIAKDVGVPASLIYDNIISFFARGSNSRKEVIIPRKLFIDDFFVEGFALYLAEGDTGLSGRNVPRKFRFTNSEMEVINLMIKWINKYFPNNPYYLLKIDPSEINYNKVMKYRLCLDSAIIIDLLLAMEKTVKSACLKQINLASAYLRGMMIGEGTAYYGKSRYVRIEMKNESEIKYLNSLFLMLGFNCTPSCRTNRENMWSIYIGADQLRRYYKLIGFGIHNKRQAILEKAIYKQLGVNQYS